MICTASVAPPRHQLKLNHPYLRILALHTKMPTSYNVPASEILSTYGYLGAGDSWGSRRLVRRLKVSHRYVSRSFSHVQIVWCHTTCCRYPMICISDGWVSYVPRIYLHMHGLYLSTSPLQSLLFHFSFTIAKQDVAQR